MYVLIIPFLFGLCRCFCIEQERYTIMEDSFEDSSFTYAHWQDVGPDGEITNNCGSYDGSKSFQICNGGNLRRRNGGSRDDDCPRTIKTEFLPVNQPGIPQEIHMSFQIKSGQGSQCDAAQAGNGVKIYVDTHEETTFLEYYEGLEYLGHWHHLNYSFSVNESFSIRIRQQNCQDESIGGQVYDVYAIDAFKIESYRPVYYHPFHFFDNFEDSSFTTANWISGNLTDRCSSYSGDWAMELTKNEMSPCTQEHPRKATTRFFRLNEISSSFPPYKGSVTVTFRARTGGGFCSDAETDEHIYVYVETLTSKTEIYQVKDDEESWYKVYVSDAVFLEESFRISFEQLICNHVGGDIWTIDDVSIFFDFSTTCSGHGNCVEQRTLLSGSCIGNCDDGYFGDFCEVTKCGEIESTDTTNVCGGHGSCRSKDECFCYGTEYFSNCSNSPDPFVCRNVSLGCEYCNNDEKSEMFIFDDFEDPQLSRFLWSSNHLNVTDRCSSFSGRNSTLLKSKNGENCVSARELKSIPFQISRIRGQTTTVIVQFHAATGFGSCEMTNFDSSKDLKVYAESEGIGPGVEKSMYYLGRVSSTRHYQSWIPKISMEFVIESETVLFGDDRFQIVFRQEFCDSGVDYWSLDDIQIEFEYVPKFTQECSFRKNCVDRKCECKKHYDYSPSCNITSCGILLSNDSNVCSSNGTCESYNNCSCNYGYVGDECSDWVCGGILYTSNDRCSGHGECIKPNTCDCIEGYYGRNCENWKCFDLLKNSYNVCNRRGVCSSFDNCTCLEGYYGANCSHSFCYGKKSENEDVCSGNGTCAGHDYCRCNEGFKGRDCRDIFCFDKAATEKSVCFSHGECVGPNECYCEENYFGENCILMVKDLEFGTGFGHSFGEHDECSFVVTYVLEESHFASQFLKEFNCSLVVQMKDYNEVLVGCRFDFLEVYGWKISIKLMMIVEHDFKEVILKNGDVNFHFQVKNVADGKCMEHSKNCEMIPLSITIHPGDVEELETKTTNDENASSGIGSEWYFFLLGFGLLICFFGLFCITVLFSCCLLFCSFFCFCCLVVSLVLFFVPLVMFGFVCCTVLVLRQRKRLSRYKKIGDEDFDILLQEHLVEKDSSIAEIRINKNLFEIKYDDVKVTRLLGSGGSGALVFLGKWREQDVAFKCFKTRRLCSDQIIFDEFEKEVELMASLSHPNIIQFFGACLKPPRVGIVMEYCENGEILNFIKEKGECPFDERIRLIREIISAMSYLHSKSVIHRDLKPNNVLIDRSGKSKLMDFGLSRVMSEDGASLSRKVGTDAFIAPEVLTGKYDEKCDSFSFAILLFVIFSEKEKPYEKKIRDGECVEFRVANDPDFRPDLSSLMHIDGNEWIKMVMKKCWNHSPKERFSFMELETIFQEVKENGSIPVNLIEMMRNKEDDESQESS